jgi:hypothetical protein
MPFLPAGAEHGSEARQSNPLDVWAALIISQSHSAVNQARP